MTNVSRPGRATDGGYSEARQHGLPHQDQPGQHEYDYIDYLEPAQRSPYMKLTGHNRSTERTGADRSGSQHTPQLYQYDQGQLTQSTSSKSFIVISRRSYVICIFINALIIAAIMAGVIVYMHLAINTGGDTGEFLSSGVSSTLKQAYTVSDHYVPFPVIWS